MQRDHLDEPLLRRAFEFFFWFSRFEAALKENGYLKSKTVGDRAEPSWEAFVAAFESGYTPSASALQLMHLAPQTQVVGPGQTLTWQAVRLPAGASPLLHVTKVLRTVRNNLFHGGKKGGRDYDDVARTTELLEAALPILRELAQLAGLEPDFEQSY